MKMKVVALLCALAMIFSMIPASAPTAEAVAVSAQATGQFMAGFAKICINPADNVAYPLGGYDNGEGRVPSDGVTDYMDDNGDGSLVVGVGGKLYDPSVALDGLFATAIAMMDENGSIAFLISMDGISVGTDIVPDTSSNNGGARSRIVTAASNLGYTVSPHDIMVNASHTHSGIYMSGNTTAPYRESLRGWLCDVAIAALQDMAPATLSKGSAATVGMNFVRHYHDSDSDNSPQDVGGDNTAIWQDGVFTGSVKECDPNIYFLQFNRTGKKDILLANWRAHPKSNSTGTTKYGLANRSCTSSDYINAFRYGLEQSNSANSEGYCVAFFQGAAGNVNTYSDAYGGLNKATLHASNPTNTKTVTTYSGVQVQTGELYGEQLAAYALTGLKSMQSVPTGEIRVSTTNLEAKQLLIQRDQFYELKDATVLSVLDAMVSEGYLSSANASTAKTNSGWATMRNMSALEFMFDYYNYGGYYGYVAPEGDTSLPSNETDDVDSTNTVVKAVMTALCKHFKINSKYHLANCYSRRNYSDTRVGTFDINAISIGTQVGIITAPFEIFDSNYQTAVLKSYGLDSAYGTPFVFGYTNIATSYMPDSDAFDYAYTGSYEVNQTYYERGTAERIAKELVSMLNDLQPKFSTTCVCGEQNVVWYPWNPKSSTEAPSGHCYLTADFVVSANWRKQVHGNLCLNLNGHNYANTSSVTGVAFVINNGATLNLMGNGTVQGQAVTTSCAGGVVEIKSGGTLNVYSGVTIARADNTTATTAQTAHTGGTVYVGEKAVLNLRGGTITGGLTTANADYSGNGGNVYVAASGKFEMFSGTVSGGSAANCGGNIFNAGTFIMHDGTVSGGAAASEGGNIYNTGTMSVEGGIITGGTALATANTGRGGNIYNAGTFTMGTATDTDDAQPLVTLGNAMRHAGNIWNNGSMAMYSGTVSDGITTTGVGSNIVSALNTSIYGGIVAGEQEGKSNIHVNPACTITFANDAIVTGYTYINGDSKFNVNGTFTGSVVLDAASAYTNKVVGTSTNAVFGKENITYLNNIFDVSISGSNIVLGKATNTPVCQIVAADGTVMGSYTTVTAAQAAYASTDDYIQLIANVSGIANITKDVYMDMNGYNMSAVIKSNAALYGMDGSTDDFTLGSGEGCGVLTVIDGNVPVETAVSKNSENYRYLALPSENNTYTFHRFTLDTKKGLRPYNEEHGTGLYFQPILQADEMVAQAINSSNTVNYGVLLSIAKDGEESIFQPFDEAADFAGGVVNNDLRAVVYDLMPSNSAVAQSKQSVSACLANMDLSGYAVTGQACFQIGGNLILDDPDQSISLREAIIKVDKLYPNYANDSAEKAGLDKMWKNYSTAIGAWFEGEDGLINIGNIKINISDWFK